MRKIMLGVLLAVTVSLVIITAVIASTNGWNCTYINTVISEQVDWVVIKNKYNCVFTPADPSLDFVYVDKTIIPRTLFFEDQPITIN